jgi:CheY-like chemotaxis protein
LEWIRGGREFDAAILDFLMPELDGIDLAAAIAAPGPDRPLPVVILSSIGQHAGPPRTSRRRSSSRSSRRRSTTPWPMRSRERGTSGAGAREAAATASRRAARRTPAAARTVLRILLAEDNAVNQKLALRLLERMGLRADVVGDGRAAVDAIEDGGYDVVLMDVQMPEMDGLEATRRIRAAWPDRPIRIVGLTANAMAGDREACIAAGMDDYVSKPIRPEELEAAIAKARPPSPEDLHDPTRRRWRDPARADPRRRRHRIQPPAAGEAARRGSATSRRRPRTAASPSNGLRDAGRPPIDVILLDIVMPVMDGYDTLAALAADPALRNIPVIVISGVDELDSVVRCLEMGAADYLPKTVDPAILAGTDRERPSPGSGSTTRSREAIDRRPRTTRSSAIMSARRSTCQVVLDASGPGAVRLCRADYASPTR